MAADDAFRLPPLLATNRDYRPRDFVYEIKTPWVIESGFLVQRQFSTGAELHRLGPFPSEMQAEVAIVRLQQQRDAIWESEREA